MPSQNADLGYFSYPEAGPVPGVVLLHDVWGASDHFKDLAARLSGEGFGVLALDLYRRESEVSIDNPGAWMRALSDPAVESDIEQAVAFLKEQPATLGQKVGVVGFCMGGMYALLAGCGGQGVAASVVYYGLLSHEHGILHAEEGLDPARKPRQPLDAVRDLRCPLLALFGEEDEFVPLADIRELKSRLSNCGSETEVVVYPAAGHAFMNETREEAFRPDVARDAWARMVAFFQRALA